MTLALAVVLVWISIFAAPDLCLGKSMGGEDESRAALHPGKDNERDPFVPTNLDLGEQLVVSPIERFSLEELRLVATACGVNPPRALIEDPNGLGFITVVGTTVGITHHKVVSIASGEIVLEPPFSVGGESAPRVVMKLGESQAHSGN